MINETNSNFRTAYWYTGRELDFESGLQYNRERYYDAFVGRWINEDPIGFGGGDANLNRYVGNSPTNATDPDGLAVFENDRIVYEPGANGIVHLYYVNAGWFWNAPPVYVGSWDPLSGTFLVDRSGNLVPLAKIKGEVGGNNTTDNWSDWFKKNKVDPKAPNYKNIVHGHVPDRHNRFAQAAEDAKELATQAVCHLASAPLVVTPNWIKAAKNFRHSFKHAPQWYGGKPTLSTHGDQWAELIARGLNSRIRFNWHSNLTPTVAYLSKQDGKYFVVHLWREGPLKGELLSAWHPSQKQLREIFGILAR